MIVDDGESDGTGQHTDRGKSDGTESNRSKRLAAFVPVITGQFGDLHDHQTDFTEKEKSVRISREGRF